MKKKFFRVEWDEGDDLDDKDIYDAITDAFSTIGLEVCEIDKSVFNWEEEKSKKEDACSITKEHNYQPSICVHCGKEKPKKIEKLDTDYKIDTFDKLFAFVLRIKDKLNELIDRINEL